MGQFTTAAEPAAKPPEQLFLERIMHGFVETEPDENGAFRLFRVPRALLPKLGNRITVRGCHPAGGELRFRTGGKPARFTLRRIPEPNHPVFTAQTAVNVGIFYGDLQFDWVALREGDNVIEIRPQPEIPEFRYRLRQRFSPELTRLVLPPFVELRIVGWEGELEPPRPGDEPAEQLLAYGSSITQGAYEPLGTATYPAVLARELGLDVCNLGFGGGAMLEPELAEWIVSRDDWHLATLELGVNLIYHTPDEVRKRVKNFLAFFAADPRRREVFVFDMLTITGEFSGDKEMTAIATTFRKIVHEEAAAAGFPARNVLEYASLLPGPSGYSADLLHPAAHAFEKIGCGLAAQIVKARISR